MVYFVLKCCLRLFWYLGGYLIWGWVIGCYILGNKISRLFILWYNLGNEKNLRLVRFGVRLL